jgi:hypothetical protein
MSLVENNLNSIFDLDQKIIVLKLFSSVTLLANKNFERSRSFLRFFVSKFLKIFKVFYF